MTHGGTGPGWPVPFLFIVASNASYIFQKEEKNTNKDPSPIDRVRDGIIFREISSLDFSPPLINSFSTFLINGDDYDGKFFNVDGRYIFIAIDNNADRATQVKSIDKLLAGIEILKSEFMRFVHSEEIFLKHSAPNPRISIIESVPEAPFEEFYVRIISDNPDYEYECLLRDFKFYDVSEIKN